MVSAGVGAGWSLFVVVYRMQARLLIDIGTYVVISYVMIRICAKGKRGKEVMQGIAALYAVTASLGGVMYVLYYETAGWFIWYIVVREKEMIVLAVSAVIIVIMLYRQLLWVREYASCMCQFCCVVGGERIQIPGYIDSGNVLTDPYFEKPVSIVQKQYFENVLKENIQKEKLKYHIIPFHSLGCEQGMLEVIIVDAIHIQCGKHFKVIQGACVGLTTQTLSSDGMYSALIPAAYAPTKMVG